MAVDKVRAEELRNAGMSYDEISQELGCSVAWCKKNLKGVKKDKVRGDIIETIRLKGRSASGITRGEINVLINAAFVGMSKDDKKLEYEKLTDAARRNRKDVIIRPYWMIPTNPRGCTNTMMDMAQELYETMHVLAKKYRHFHNLDESYQNSIAYGLHMLTSGEYNSMMPQGLNKKGTQMDVMCSLLEERNTLHDVIESGHSKGFKHPVDRTLDFSEEPIPY